MYFPPLAQQLHALKVLLSSDVATMRANIRARHFFCVTRTLTKF